MAQSCTVVLLLQRWPFQIKSNSALPPKTHYNSHTTHTLKQQPLQSRLSQIMNQVRDEVFINRRGTMQIFVLTSKFTDVAATCLFFKLFFLQSQALQFNVQLSKSYCFINRLTHLLGSFRSIL